MARAEDARCLYCNGKIPLFRKLTSGQFCSKEHEKVYWKEQERLAIEVLHRTHDTLMAYQPPPGDIELIIGPPVEWNPEPDRTPAMPIPEPQHVEETPAHYHATVEIDQTQFALPNTSAEPAPEPKPASLHKWGDLLASSVSVPTPVAAEVADPEMAGFLVQSAPPLNAAIATGHQILAADPVPYESTAPLLELDQSLRDMPTPQASPLEPVFLAASLPLNLSSAYLKSTATSPAAIHPRVGTPIQTRASLISEGPDWAEIYARQVREGLMREARIREAEIQEKEAREARAREAWLRQLAEEAAAVEAAAAAAVPPWATWLSLPRPERAVPAAAGIVPSPLAQREPISRVRKLLRSIPPPDCQPYLAVAERYSLYPALVQAEPREGYSFVTPRCLPQLPFFPGRLAKPEARQLAGAGLASLDCLREFVNSVQHGEPEVVQVKIAAVPFGTATFRPRLRLGPEAWPKEVPLRAEPLLAIPADLPDLREQRQSQNFLHLVTGFWTKGPRDLRLLLFLIPALGLLAFHPSLPKVKVSAVEATSGVQRNIGTAANGSWTNFKRAVADRAAVALDEDFRQGLDDWISPGGAATEWSFDANGFVRPGTLAIYSPTMSLEDYQMQFLALIDKKALSWVVRAADFENYYVVKLVVLKPGPMTTLGLTRYAVIKGVPQDRKDTPVALNARPDMIYRIHMDVVDENMALTIQGQVVDAWAEPRLKHGGVGFFSARGEESRVRWLQVTHQFDMLGRLCAYLAPFDMPGNPAESVETSTNSEGNWK